MKTIARGVLVLLFASATARAQFEGVAEMRFATTGGKPATSGIGRVYVSGTGWRNETETTSPETDRDPGRGPIKTVWIGMLSDPGTIYRINETTKTYDVLHARRGRVSSSRMGPENTVQMLGSDRVAGLPCERVRVTPSRSRTRIDACLSREFVTGEWLRTLPRESAGGDFMAALKAAGLEGYPIRVETKEADGSGLTMEVTRIERRPVPDSTFEIPAGYSRADFTTTRIAQATEPQQVMEDHEKLRREIMENLTSEQRRALEDPLKDNGEPSDEEQPSPPPPPSGVFEAVRP